MVMHVPSAGLDVNFGDMLIIRRSCEPCYLEDCANIAGSRPFSDGR